VAALCPAASPRQARLDDIDADDFLGIEGGEASHQVLGSRTCPASEGLEPLLRRLVERRLPGNPSVPAIVRKWPHQSWNVVAPLAQRRQRIGRR